MRMETSVVINRPIEDVWAILSDPFNAPRWQRAWLRIHQTSPGPLGLGTTLQMRWVLFGLEWRVSAVVTEWDPPHTATMSVTGAGIRSGWFRIILEATVDGTKVVRVAEIEPRPALKPLFWFLRLFARRRGEAQDQRIKRLVESGPG